MLYIQTNKAYAFCVDIKEGMRFLMNPNFHDILESREEYDEFWISDQDDGKLYIEDVGAELEITIETPQYLAEEEDDEERLEGWYEFVQYEE